MDRRSFLRAATAAAVPLAGEPVRLAAQTQPESESRARIRKAKAAAWAMQRRDWEQGILAQALLEAGDRDSVILLTHAAMVQRTPDGRMAVVVTGGCTDPAMGGAAYAQAAAWTGDKE